MLSETPACPAQNSPSADLRSPKHTHTARKLAWGWGVTEGDLRSLKASINSFQHSWEILADIAQTLRILSNTGNNRVSFPSPGPRQCERDGVFPVAMEPTFPISESRTSQEHTLPKCDEIERLGRGLVFV